MSHEACLFFELCAVLVSIKITGSLWGSITHHRTMQACIENTA